MPRSNNGMQPDRRYGGLCAHQFARAGDARLTMKVVNEQEVTLVVPAAGPGRSSCQSLDDSARRLSQAL